MYKVKIKMSREGYFPSLIEGIYYPKEAANLSIKEMKKDVLAWFESKVEEDSEHQILSQIERDEFGLFRKEVVLFKQIDVFVILNRNDETI